jgi:hypothetical protein
MSLDALLERLMNDQAAGTAVRAYHAPRCQSSILVPWASPSPRHLR